MSEVTYEYTGDEDFPLVVSSRCRSLAEARKKASLMASVSHDAFLPTAPELAVRDTGTATGGGDSSQTLLRPEPPPDELIEALQERAESDDPQVGSLKAGEAA